MRFGSVEQKALGTIPLMACVYARKPFTRTPPPSFPVGVAGPVRAPRRSRPARTVGRVRSGDPEASGPCAEREGSAESLGRGSGGHPGGWEGARVGRPSGTRTGQTPARPWGWGTEGGGGTPVVRGEAPLRGADARLERGESQEGGRSASSPRGVWKTRGRPAS